MVGVVVVAVAVVVVVVAVAVVAVAMVAAVVDVGSPSVLPGGRPRGHGADQAKPHQT